MSNISDSVGRGGANQPEDVRIVQELLNRHISPPQQPIEVDGAVGSKTIAAIEAFQRNVVNMANPDGRVDPDGRTFAAPWLAVPLHLPLHLQRAPHPVCRLSVAEPA